MEARGDHGNSVVAELLGSEGMSPPPPIKLCRLLLVEEGCLGRCPPLVIVFLGGEGRKRI
jgi:hypothetical protein